MLSTVWITIKFVSNSLIHQASQLIKAIRYINMMYRQIPMHIVLKTYMFIGEHELTKSKIYYAL